MKKVTFLLTLLLLLVACGGEGVSFSTANISQAQLTKDEAGTQATSTFAPEDVFYLIVDLANAPDSTTVKASWTAVNVAGAPPNTPLDDVTLTSGSGALTYQLANDGPWPVGDYKVDVYLNDELERTLDFRVTAGLGSESEPATSGETAEAEPTAEAVSETTSPASATGAVSNLQDVKSAAIQIEAQGTFRDPEVGTLYNAAGRGSGFIIDPSGIAVTNNHVVTGAALIKVWVGGESEPRNARVLGVSECADLAVIDIEGEGFPYLTWYDGSVDVGLDVYAAGFPLGDPEYTLTRGIVSKAEANGKTNWASVAAVIEHDATINPGNSGGALVTADGQVVAVNYAGASNVGQFFAIAQPQALPIIEQLRQGQDALSIGVNGTAVNNGEGLSGIWVSSVKSGSPADMAGIKGGDIILSLQGLVLATDGTMGDYCDILRTHSAEDVMAIEVLRFDTEEVLEGQLNGRELTQAFSFAQQVAQEAGAAPSATDAGQTGTSYSYVNISDDSGLMKMNVPSAWQQVDGSPWELEGEIIGLSLTASPNIEQLLSTWDTPGVFFGASDQLTLTVGEVLDAFDYTGQCTYNGRTDYQDEVYSGLYDFWYDCGGSGTMVLVLSALPADQSYITLVLVQMVNEADLEAADQILASFIVEE